MPSNFRRNGLFTALVTAVCTAIFTGLFMGRPARAQPVAPPLSAEAQASFEPLRKRSIIGEALGWGGPGLWLLGTTSGVASVVTEMNGPPKTNHRGWTNASIATMGVARVSTTTGSALLAVSSLQGAALLHAEGVPVPRYWGTVAAIGATAQLTALVGQASAGSVFEPHTVWWIGAVGGKEARFIPLSLAGWGTSMVAGTVQHRRNVQAAGLRPKRASKTGRAQLNLLPGPRSVTVIGHF